MSLKKLFEKFYFISKYFKKANQSKEKNANF